MISHVSRAVVEAGPRDESNAYAECTCARHYDLSPPSLPPVPCCLVMQACAALLNSAIGGWKACGVPHLLFVTAVSFVAHKIVLPAVKARKLKQEHLLEGVCVFPSGGRKPLSKERLSGMT